jgi:hypothetical protein
VTANFCGRGIDPQELAGQLEALAVGEGDFQDAGFLVQLDFCGLRGILTVHAKFLDCKTKIVPDKSLR